MTSHQSIPATGPALRLLSLGAEVQSTTVSLLAREDLIPRFDLALFADTGWEPHQVYENLTRPRLHRERRNPGADRLGGQHPRRHPRSRPSVRVDAAAPAQYGRQSRLGTQAMLSQYKVGPLKKAARELPGDPHPQRTPRGLSVEVSKYPAERGFAKTVTSACLGWLFHGNAGWWWIRDHHDLTDGLALSPSTRPSAPAICAPHSMAQQLRGQHFPHRSCRPLDEVDLEPSVSTKRQRRLIGTNQLAAADENDPDAYSPSCLSRRGRRSATPGAPWRTVTYDEEVSHDMNGRTRTTSRRGLVQPGTRPRRPTPRPLPADPVEPGGEGEQVLYTAEQAAALLQVRPSWLRRKAAARVVPCRYLGKHLRFTRADIEAIAEAAATPLRQPGHHHQRA